MSLDQSIKTEHGIAHNIAGTTVFLPEVPEEELGAETVSRFTASLTYVNSLHQRTQEVMADNLLSDMGKEAQLKEQRESALLTIASQIEGLDKFEESIATREAALLEIPEIGPQNLTEASIDRELRDYWRTLTIDQQTSIMNEMNEGPKYQRLELALLRSPYAQLDHQITVVRDSWNRGKRLENPAEAFAIASMKNSLDWGRRAMAHLAPIALKTSSLPGDAVVKTLVKEGRDKAAKAFGFSSEQIERVRRLLEVEKQRGR